MREEREEIERSTKEQVKKIQKEIEKDREQAQEEGLEFTAAPEDEIRRKLAR